MMVQTNTLKIIAAVGAVVALGGAAVFTELTQRHHRNAEYMRKSVSILLNYQPVKEKLGEPLQVKRLDLSFKKNYVQKHSAMLTIPVRGPAGTATLYSWTSRASVKSSWEVDQCDLEVDKTKQRWTFYKRPGAPVQGNTDITSENDSSEQSELR